MELKAMYRAPSLAPDDFEGMLQRESKIVTALVANDPLMTHANWRLTADSLDEANLYPAFDERGNPSTAALAALTTRAGGKRRRVAHAAIWNAVADAGTGASMSCQVTDSKAVPDRFSLEIDSQTTFSAVGKLADIVESIVSTFEPDVVEVYPTGYFDRRVFDDKPGVGAMLYLPRVITTQQVPEARELLPISDARGKRFGTLIVSVVDAVFSPDDPEHVAIANRIEIRLVDQDLLPRYVEI